MRQIIFCLPCFSYSFSPIHPGCFWECNTRLIQRLCFVPVCHAEFLHCTMVQVKPCGLQTEQIAGINVSIQRCYLPPCSRDRTVPHISAFLSTKVCRQKTIFYWKSYRQASTFNPELALQCLSEPPEEFKADHIFLCVCACYLIFEVLQEAVICLQPTRMQCDCKSLRKQLHDFLAPI